MLHVSARACVLGVCVCAGGGIPCVCLPHLASLSLSAGPSSQTWTIGELSWPSWLSLAGLIHNVMCGPGVQASVLQPASQWQA